MGDGNAELGSARWDLRSDPRRPLPEQIADKIRELIATGDFTPGQQLPNEPALARRMGVARSSVRTALQRLEVLRMVEVKRGRGWFVRSVETIAPGTTLLGRIAPGRPKLGELMEVRMALEGMAASLAAARADPGEIDDIAKLASAHANTPPADIEQLVQTDEEFHDAIFRASRNELLMATYRMLVPELSEFRRVTFTDRGVPARSATDHHTISTFLKRGDSAGSRAAMVSHLLGPYQAVQAGSADDRPETVQLSAFLDPGDEPDWPVEPVDRSGG